MREHISFHAKIKRIDKSFKSPTCNELKTKQGLACSSESITCTGCALFCKVARFPTNIDRFVCPLLPSLIDPGCWCLYLCTTFRFNLRKVRDRFQNLFELSLTSGRTYDHIGVLHINLSWYLTATPEQGKITIHPQWHKIVTKERYWCATAYSGPIIHFCEIPFFCLTITSEFRKVIQHVLWKWNLCFQIYFILQNIIKHPY